MIGIVSFWSSLLCLSIRSIRVYKEEGGCLCDSYSRTIWTALDGPACAAYLDIILLPLSAVARSSTARCAWLLIYCICALLLLEEDILILIGQRNPSLQAVVELELGAIRLHSDVLAVELGERDPIIILKFCWIRGEGEDLRDGLFRHTVLFCCLEWLVELVAIAGGSNEPWKLALTFGIDQICSTERYEPQETLGAKVLLQLEFKGPH